MSIKIICVVNDTVNQSMGLQSEHGLSFWIETDQGSILFDTGRTGAVFSHNLSISGLSIPDIRALALSHAHNDHTGGVERLLGENPGIPVYGHTDIFRPRYNFRNGKYQFVGFPSAGERLAKQADLHLSDTPVEIIPGVWTTGEIIERPEPEGRSAQHYIKTEDGWQSDRYKDDLSLIVDKREGLAVVCGCCHAGILNTLFHVERMFKRPIITVIGGIHLMSAEESYIDHVINVIKDRFGDTSFYLNHCTGDKALKRLMSVLGNGIKPCPAGTVINFND
jgi:7,8-dihydropterin-6-yl-methyl-4-(beta-D-ribofuranosyl)aminobenzene 5'-phosphate synthase